MKVVAENPIVVAESSLEQKINNLEFKLRVAEAQISLLNSLVDNNIIITAVEKCNYQQDDTTAMNCIHCGKGKWLH